MTGLRDLLWPEAIAVIGASADPTALSGRPLPILRRSGYTGALYPVNPRHRKIDDLTAYPDIASVPGDVDVALVLVRKTLVPDVLAQCARAGVGLAVVFSSGFAEESDTGAEVERQLAELARTTGMRVIGPNAEGFLNAPGRVAATFSPAVEANLGQHTSERDHLVVISQSGGIGFAVFDRGVAAGLGVDHVISTGNEADVDAVDLVAELTDDPAVRVLLLVVEGFRQPQRFLEVAQRAGAAGKSIVVAKLGSSVPGARAALAHTAHDVGSAAAYQAAFRDVGVYLTQDEDELVDIGMVLARTPPAAGRRVGIMTTSGGAGVWLTDACAARGLTVPELSAPLRQELRGLMPSYGSPRNPVDLTADAIHGGGLVGALELLLASDEVDSVAVIVSLANPTGLAKHADRIGELVAGSTKPVVFYTYTRPAAVNVRLLADLGVSWFPSATRTARAMALLADRAGVPARRPVFPRWPADAGAAGAILAEVGLATTTANGTGGGVELIVRVVGDDGFGPVVVLPTEQDHGVVGVFVPAGRDDALRVVDRLPEPARTALSGVAGGPESLSDVLARAARAVSGEQRGIRELALRLRLGEREGGPVHVLDAAVVRDGDPPPSDEAGNPRESGRTQ